MPRSVVGFAICRFESRLHWLSADKLKLAAVPRINVYPPAAFCNDLLRDGDLLAWIHVAKESNWRSH